MTNIGIGLIPDGWVIFVDMNEICYKSSYAYSTVDEAAVAMAQSFPSMSAELLTSIVQQAKDMYDC